MNNFEVKRDEYIMNIKYPSLSKIYCERCKLEIFDTSSKYMADDRSFCSVLCRRIFLNKKLFT